VHTQDLTLCLGEATFLPVVEKKEKKKLVPPFGLTITGQ
jgi:hypothetical protein